MLTAVMRHLEAKAIDDALDLFEILMATRLISTAKRSTDKQRLSTLPQLEKASRIVARAAAVFIEELELIEETGRAGRPQMRLPHGHEPGPHRHRPPVGWDRPCR